MVEKKPEYWVGTPPEKCELCLTPIGLIFIDGKTKRGPWGCLCLTCHQLHGKGLGLGLGQKYALKGDGPTGWVKIDG